MGYKIQLDGDNDRGIVLGLNEACEAMQRAWHDSVTMYSKWCEDALCPRCCLAAMVEDLLKVNDGDSGSALFFFRAPPASTSEMARRLCSSVGYVAESIFEEVVIDDEVTGFAKTLHMKTAWSFRCPKAGEREDEERNNEWRRTRIAETMPGPRRIDIIDAKLILEITSMVWDLQASVSDKLQDW
jgi:hypothetical protein